LAWAYQSAGDEEKSARTFRKLAEENPQGELAAEGYFRNAEYFFSKGKYEKALKGFTKSYKAANNDVKIGERAINKIGWTAFQMSDFNQAKQAFDEQRKRFPAGELTADAAMMTAECDFQQKDYGRALDGFERALPNVPRDSTLKPLGMLHAAQCATKADNWRLASTLLQQMKQDYPESNYLDEAEYELAWSLQNQDKIDEALPLYSAVADRTTRPIGARARFMEGELLFAKKQYPEAIRVFFKVAYGYGYPESPDAYHEWQANSMFEAARCCESTKRISSAKRLYEDLIKHFPENSKAATARKKLAAISRK
jgi:TolA-binding protein